MWQKEGKRREQRNNMMTAREQSLNLPSGRYTTALTLRRRQSIISRWRTTRTMRMGQHHHHHHHRAPLVDYHWVPSELSTSHGLFFHCLSGTVTIPFDALNDDFCDCPDGSDEPGTAACTGASWLFRERRRPAGGAEGWKKQSGFYCPNRGYLPKFVHHTMTDDGICDCCDGSDEWRSGLCPDACEEQAKEWKAERVRVRAEVKKGLFLKHTYGEEGKAWLEGCRKQLAVLKHSLAQLIEEAVVAEAKVKNQTTEVPAKLTDEELSAPEGKAAGTEKLEEDTQGTVSEFTKWALHDGIDAETEEKYYKSVVDPEDTEDSSPAQSPLNWLSSVHTQLVRVSAAVGSVGRLPPPYASVEIRRHYDEFMSKRGWAECLGVLEHGFKFLVKQCYNTALDVSKSLNLIGELQKPLEEHANDLRADVKYTEFRVQELQAYLDLNLGANTEFYPLTRQCAKTSFDGFDYEICFFKEATQMERGHSHYLGRMVTFQQEDAKSQELTANFPEDVVAHEEEDVAGAQVYVMRFRKGSRCHDNTRRELTVKFVCGGAVQIMQVHEPSRCRYYATVKCPSACTVDDERKLAVHEPGREEL
eukprot:GHVS01058160.1.p1 GENE.GHVS01058160.1~~GHVS01058160.1.p1  ORF type:complete len:588 (-),score=112.55 GHVS01058160.1:326-2089(-)